LLIVFGYLSVAIAAASPGHLHNTQTAHSCAVCQLTLTPFDTTLAGPAVWPPEASDHGVSDHPTRLYAGCLIISGSSRAPPLA
jgi:hypothetical protein